MASTFSWTKSSPAEIAAVIGRFGDQAPNIAFDVTQSEAGRAEEWMKQHAPWQDRTAHARQGLFSTAEHDGDTILMHFGGTMEYIPFLELGTSKMRPRRIIIPAFHRWRNILPMEVSKTIMETFVP